MKHVARLLVRLGLPLGPLVVGLLLQATSPRITVALIVGWLAPLIVIVMFSRSIRAAPDLGELSVLHEPAATAMAPGIESAPVEA